MLVVPKAYYSEYDKIKAADDFRQISILLWVDSVPADYIDRIESIGYPALISPLHDKDVLDDGSPKKAHYHVLFTFPGKKTGEQCQKIANYISHGDEFSGDYPWLYVVDRYVHARYLCHLDSPKKYRYSVSDVVSVNGASISKLIGKDWADEDLDDIVLLDIISWVRDNQIYYFNILVDYALYEKKDIWIKRLKKDLTPFVKTYMQGLSLQASRLRSNHTNH